MCDTFCPVIPTSDSTSINVILSDLHSSALVGHLGFKKLLKAISTRFYWKGIYLTVKTFIQRCAVC